MLLYMCINHNYIQYLLSEKGGRKINKYIKQVFLLEMSSLRILTCRMTQSDTTVIDSSSGGSSVG